MPYGFGRAAVAPVGLLIGQQKKDMAPRSSEPSSGRLQSVRQW